MPSPNAPEFERLLARIADALDRHDLLFMVIGGQAVLLHGEPRLTQDIDITLGMAPDRVAEVLTICETVDCAPLPEDPSAFARRTFVLPVADRASGIRVDFIFSTTPYEQEAIERAQMVSIEGTLVPFATPEDLILHKLFAGRPRDLEDVRGVIARKGSTIDWGYVERWAVEFSVVEGRGNLPEIVRSARTESDKRWSR
jgi:hypothetical protein